MITRDFTDIHGIAHTNCEVVVHRAGKQNVTETSVSYHDNYVESPPSSVESVHYQMCYWASTEARANGAECFIFKVFDELSEVHSNEGVTLAWRFELTEEYDGLTLIEAVEKHFSEVVFPVIAE